MSEEKSTYRVLNITILGKQPKSKVKFLMWEGNFKGMVVAKGFSSELTGIKDMYRKY